MSNLSLLKVDYVSERDDEDSLQPTSYEITKASEDDVSGLFQVWESSIRATHHFLTESNIRMLIPLVKKSLSHFSPIYCLRDPEGKVFAFLGVEKSKIEMLFVHSDHRGHGAGKFLVRFGIDELGANLVDVNEQNESAVAFYEHLGFRRFGRSELDSLGNPFPILHMQLCLSPGSADPTVPP